MAFRTGIIFFRMLRREKVLREKVLVKKSCDSALCIYQ